MPSQLGYRVQQVVQRVLAHFGLQLVRWPKPAKSTTSGALPKVPRPGTAAKAAPVSSPPGVGTYFPHGSRPHKPWRLPPDLDADPRQWARTLVGVYKDPLSWPTCIAPEGGMLLQALIRNIQPETVVETGTALGASTIWLAAGLEANGHGALWTYDLFVPPKDPDRHDHPLFNPPFENVAKRLADAGVGDLVTMRRGDSAANLAADADTLRARGGVQFAFIDGDHSPKGILADFIQLEPMLAVGGYLVLHDVYPELSHQVGPRWLLDHLTEHARGRYEVCDLYLAQTNYGMTVLRRTG